MFTGIPRRGMGFMPAGGADEDLLADLYKKVPEFRKRSRRAKALRGKQDRLEEMASKERPLGEVSQTSHGGLYQTQGSYIPNLSGMGEKLVGGIGSYLGDRPGSALEQAESAVDELQAEELLRNAEKLGRRARARRKTGGYGY